MGRLADKAKETFELSTKRKEEELNQEQQKERARIHTALQLQVDKLIEMMGEEYTLTTTLTDSPKWGPGINIEDENLTFVVASRVATSPQGLQFQGGILGICPKCEEEAISEPVVNLEVLGRLLTNFTAGNSHDCKNQFAGTLAAQ